MALAKPKAGRRRASRGTKAVAGPGLPSSGPPAAAPFAEATAISNVTARTVLANGLGGLIPPGELPVRLTIADTRYLETPVGFVLSSITTDPVLSVSSYHRDVFDCDDYVLYLKVKLGLFAAVNRLGAPPAVGFLFTTEHAFSFCISAGASLVLVNTQSPDRAIEGRPERFASFLSVRPDNPITLVYL